LACSPFAAPSQGAAHTSPGASAEFKDFRVRSAEVGGKEADHSAVLGV
jgi:hypothetical protein